MGEGVYELHPADNVIPPYPTQANVMRKAADEYNLSRFTPSIKKTRRHLTTVATVMAE